MFIPVLLAIAAGFAAGRLRRRGSAPAQAGVIRLRGAGLVVPALGLTLLPVVVALGRTGDVAATIAAFVLIGVFLALNIHAARGWFRAGLVVLAFGWTLNLFVIALNGGMPLSLDAYARSGQRGEPAPGRAGFYRIVIADEATRLRFLGDVIPVRPLANVYSAGDVIVTAGLAIAVPGATSERSAVSPSSRAALRRRRGAPARPTADAP